MHADRMAGDRLGDDWSLPDREDAKWQRAVLALLLDQQPRQLSQAEVAREILDEKPCFEERDAFERAVEGLIKGGLLRRCESLLLPTRAARLFASLESD